MAKKLKVKTRKGDIIDYPINVIKDVLDKAGFTGKHLVSATRGVAKEAAKLTKTGIVSAANLEKAIVRSVNNTNSVVMNNAKKITKRLLK